MSNNWKALFVGDVIILKEPQNALVCGDFKGVISKHDIVSCNLETQLETKYGDPIPKAFSLPISMPVEAAKWIKDAGFNVISLATNHMYDYGAAGLAVTLDSFSDVITVGAGIDYESAYSLKVKDVKGTKVGFLSFCEAEHGAIVDDTVQSGGYAWINHPSVNFRIIEAKKKVDVLIIQCHAGLERTNIPLPELRKRYHEFISYGADAVIGHHPHIPQGWEIYKGKPIFYSIGHFYFDYQKKHELWDKSFAASLSFNGSEFLGYEIIPFEKTDRGVRIYDDESFKKHLEYLCKLLEPETYMVEVNRQAIEYWEKRYSAQFTKTITLLPKNVFLENIREITRKIIKKLFKNTHLIDRHFIDNLALLHSIRIESHRWTIERALSQLEENRRNKIAKYKDIYSSSKKINSLIEDK